MLVKGGAVVVEATDAVFERSDPTAHAERAVISDYCAAHGLLHLRGYELYCFIEPCLMCCSAVHWAKVSRVVVSVSQAILQTLSGGLQKPTWDSLVNTGGRQRSVGHTSWSRG